MKYKEGDIFTFPIEGKLAFGQIIALAEKETMTVVIYRELSLDNELFINEIADAEILLFATTFDAKILKGDWKIISNYKDNLDRIIYPFYLEYTMSDAELVVDYYGNPVRNATPFEEEYLINKNYHSPVRLEKAMKAAYSDEKNWKNIFSDLLYEYNLNSNSLVVNNQLIG